MYNICTILLQWFYNTFDNISKLNKSIDIVDIWGNVDNVDIGGNVEYVDIVDNIDIADIVETGDKVVLVDITIMLTLLAIL